MNEKEKIFWERWAQPVPKENFGILEVYNARTQRYDKFPYIPAANLMDLLDERVGVGRWNKIYDEPIIMNESGVDITYRKTGEVRHRSGFVLMRMVLSLSPEELEQPIIKEEWGSEFLDNPGSVGIVYPLMASIFRRAVCLTLNLGGTRSLWEKDKIGIPPAMPAQKMSVNVSSKPKPTGYTAPPKQVISAEEAEDWMRR